MVLKRWFHSHVDGVSHRKCIHLNVWDLNVFSCMGYILTKFIAISSSSRARVLSKYGDEFSWLDGILHHKYMVRKCFHVYKSFVG